MTMDLKKELGMVGKEMQSLSRKLAKLILEADRLEKSKPKIPKTKPVKKVPAKKPVANKSAKLSATDTVLTIINRSKKGVHVSALMKKTGFNEKKVQNVIYKLKKQEKIKSERKGVYVKA